MIVAELIGKTLLAYMQRRQEDSYRIALRERLYECARRPRRDYGSPGILNQPQSERGTKRQRDGGREEQLTTVPLSLRPSFSQSLLLFVSHRHFVRVLFLFGLFRDPLLGFGFIELQDSFARSVPDSGEEILVAIAVEDQFRFWAVGRFVPDGIECHSLALLGMADGQRP